jgi:glycosyltransferase involved in cell wall biosynthesis
VKTVKKILFLYTELASYILDCFKELGETGVEVHVVMYPVNTEAPFKLSLEINNCTFYNRISLDEPGLTALLDQITPQAIVVSGWIDKLYLNVVKNYHRPASKVLVFDSKDYNTLRGFTSMLRARALYRPNFHYAWVPGRPQKVYAKLMGFSDKSILTGFYTTDVQRFESFGWHERSDFPHRFVFVGRYTDFKGVYELWEAFVQLRAKNWVLDCAGTGPDFEKRRIAPGITHKGFVQPDELDTFVAEGGVFVLPSHKEPWGVVVHEFASAGYPLLCSSSVGAADQFLREGQNGYYFEPKSVDSLKAALQKIVRLTDQELWSMSEKSKELAKSLTIDNWVQTAQHLIDVEE